MTVQDQVSVVTRPGSRNHRPVVIDHIPFQPDLQKLMKKLRVREGTRHVDRLAALVEESQTIARPRAMYVTAYIEAKEEDSVVIDGVKLESRVLRVNLEGVHRVFPFVATAGSELYDWQQAQDDLLLRYYADVIGETALRSASATLKRRIAEQYKLGKTSSMSPGSLKDWPIEAQRPLFRLLGDPQDAVGVRLSDSLLMLPPKSVSGIRFPVEKTFESCQLCPMERCPSRQAPYDEGLYERRYRAASHSTAAS